MKITHSQADRMVNILAELWADQRGKKIKKISIYEKEQGK